MALNKYRSFEKSPCPRSSHLSGEKPSKQVLSSQLILKTSHKMNRAQQWALMGSGGFIRQEVVGKGLAAQVAFQLKPREVRRQGTLSLPNLRGRFYYSAHLTKGAGRGRHGKVKSTFLSSIQGISFLLPFFVTCTGIAL